MNSSDALKDHLLMNGRHKNIQMDPTSSAYRLILLRESELSQIPIPLREWLLQQPSVSIAPMSRQQHYADCSAEEVDDGVFFHVGISSHSSKRHRATHIV